jgi:hypothetical protein
MGHRRERYCKWQRNLTEPSAAPADLGLAYDALSERRVRTNYSGIRPPSLPFVDGLDVLCEGGAGRLIFRRQEVDWRKGKSSARLLI